MPRSSSLRPRKSSNPRCYKCLRGTNLHIHGKRINKDGSLSIYRVCAPCNLVMVKASRAKNPNAQRRSSRKYYEANKEKFREWARLRKLKSTL